MGRVVVDEETGESLTQPVPDSDIWRLIGSQSIRMNNAETGEPEVSIDHTNTSIKSRRVPFQIPKEVKDNFPGNCESATGKKYKGSDLIDLEPVPVGACFRKINPICLFLPAIFYFRWFLALLMIFEVVLHIWAHHKNKALKNANVYFRSPFHALSSEFCALCQNETCMNRVGKMQQIRMHKFLRQCNYMKKVVT